MSGHTPGPWINRHNQHNGARIDYVETDDGTTICDMYYRDRRATLPYDLITDPYPRAEANAALIAAAPETAAERDKLAESNKELLAALKEHNRVLSEFFETWATDGTGGINFGEISIRGSAAISAAESLTGEKEGENG